MDTQQKMTMRVTLTEVDIRKVILNTRPATVDALTSQLKESLGLHYNFSHQYKDPEFNHELCNLTDTEDLQKNQHSKSSLYLICYLSQHLMKSWVTHTVQQIMTSSQHHLTQPTQIILSLKVLPQHWSASMSLSRHRAQPVAVVVGKTVSYIKWLITEQNEENQEALMLW